MSARRDRSLPRGVPPLSPRKLEAFERCSRGERRCDVARAMGLAPETISKYVEDVDEHRASMGGLRAVGARP